MAWGKGGRPDLAARNRARKDPTLLYNTNTSECRIWKGMIARCHNPKSKDYGRYGARGIVVCDAWRASAAAFFASMGARPSASHGIDRIDNDGPYNASNCRWATNTEQARNRRSNRLITLRGETLCVAEWAERLGVSRQVIRHRLESGWSDEAALTLPRNHSYRHDDPTGRQRGITAKPATSAKPEREGTNHDDQPTGGA